MVFDLSAPPGAIRMLHERMQTEALSASSSGYPVHPDPSQTSALRTATREPALGLQAVAVGVCSRNSVAKVFVNNSGRSSLAPYM